MMLHCTALRCCTALLPYFKKRLPCAWLELREHRPLDAMGNCVQREDGEDDEKEGKADGEEGNGDGEEGDGACAENSVGVGVGVGVSVRVGGSSSSSSSDDEGSVRSAFGVEAGSPSKLAVDAARVREEFEKCPGRMQKGGAPTRAAPRSLHASFGRRRCFETAHARCPQKLSAPLFSNPV